MHGTGTTLRDAASVLCACHAEPLADDPEQRRFGIGIDVPRVSVDIEFDHGARSHWPERRPDVSMTPETTQYSRPLVVRTVHGYSVTNCYTRHLPWKCPLPFSANCTNR